METNLPKKRQLPKLMACMTKTSLGNLRNRALFSLEALDAKGIRRRKRPLHQCLILELRESGFFESSDYLQDLIYDNIQLVKNDDIGIVVDLRKREDYLEHICAGLIQAEKCRDREMLTAMKTAKKKKEQNESDETDEIVNENDNIVRNDSILSKPVASAQPLAIEETSNEKTIEQTKK